ncbi:MAG: Minor capsid protein [Bacteriophage sp.]|nr:MAG: Minor capsid protein [Bacteriophage sp.]UWG70156.1 MAG: Minor capsid protein from bacteriophage [Bacteriophage sp.]UWG88660.1 MAG: Minor capsid protein from bacteriophage [Bacteriophage sp.]
MKNKKFNLQTALVKLINRYIDEGSLYPIEDHIFIQFLDKDDHLGLVASPGAHIVDVDYSGQAKWVYNYVATIRTKNRAEAYDKLNKLSEFLQRLNKTKELISYSKDHPFTSFIFDSISVSSDVHEIQEDLQGTVTYQLDVAVFVYRNGEF